MFHYYEQISCNLTDWSYIDITLEAYDKLEKLLEESKQIYAENPIIARGNFIKCSLIILALAQTLNDEADNMISKKLKNIYYNINTKLMEYDINQINILIQTIQLLRQSISLLKAVDRNDDIHRYNQIVRSIVIEA
jgi:flagellin-specific chaperone FliS